MNGVRPDPEARAAWVAGFRWKQAVDDLLLRWASCMRMCARMFGWHGKVLGAGVQQRGHDVLRQGLHWVMPDGMQGDGISNVMLAWRSQCRSPAPGLHKLRALDTSTIRATHVSLAW
jgi:hypothetical protein